MDNVFLYRGCSIPKGYIGGNPLLIKNFQARDPVRGLFYSLARNSSYDKEARYTAEGWARFHAKKLNQEPLVTVLGVNEESFSVLRGRIYMPLIVFGIRREKLVSSLNELINVHSRVRLPRITVSGEGMNQKELELLYMRLGKLNPEDVFIYQDIVSTQTNVEGSHISRPEIR